LSYGAIRRILQEHPAELDFTPRGGSESSAANRKPRCVVT
jgi:hypothetical protein